MESQSNHQEQENQALAKELSRMASRYRVLLEKMDKWESTLMATPQDVLDKMPEPETLKRIHDRKKALEDVFRYTKDHLQFLQQNGRGSEIKALVSVIEQNFGDPL